MLILNMLTSILFNGKVNLVEAFGRSKFIIVFKSARKNKIKIMEKWEFLRNIDYGFWCNSKINYH